VSELAEAETNLTQGLDLCRQAGLDGQYAGQIQWARLCQAKGDLQGARDQLRQLEQDLRRRDFTLMVREVSLRLAMEDVAGTWRLVSPIREALEGDPYSRRLPLVAQEALKLCLARVYLARGEVQLATSTLHQVQSTAGPGQRLGRMVEVHLLLAPARQQQDGRVMRSGRRRSPGASRIRPPCSACWARYTPPI